MAILKQHAQEHHKQSGHRADSHREKLELLGFHTSSVPVLAVGVKVSASFFSPYPPTSRGSSPPNARAFPISSREVGIARVSYFQCTSPSGRSQGFRFFFLALSPHLARFIASECARFSSSDLSAHRFFPIATAARSFATP